MLLTKHLRFSQLRLYLKFAYSFCIRFEEQPFPPSHTQQLLPRDSSSQLNYSTFLDLDKGILPCWYSPRKLRRKVLLLASTSIPILLHPCFSTKPAIWLQIQGPSHPFLTTTSQSWQEELSPSLLQAARTIHKQSKSASLWAFSHSKPLQKAPRKQLSSLCKNTFKDAWSCLQEPSASSYFRFLLMVPTDMVALGPPMPTNIFLEVTQWSAFMVYASKSDRRSAGSQESTLLTVKKKKLRPLDKNMHCRGTLPDKPILRISTTSYTPHYSSQNWTFVPFPPQSVSGDSRRKEGHNTPCDAQEQSKPFEFCYFIRAPAKLLTSNS